MWRKAQLESLPWVVCTCPGNDSWLWLARLSSGQSLLLALVCKREETRVQLWRDLPIHYKPLFTTRWVKKSQRQTDQITQYAKQRWRKKFLHSCLCIVLASSCLWTCSLCKYELLLVANGRLFLLVVTKKKKMYQCLKMPMDSCNCSIVVCSFF